MMAEMLRVSRLPDPFRAGQRSGWKVIDASTLTDDRSFEADVAIVGTGAGAAPRPRFSPMQGCRW